MECSFVTSVWERDWKHVLYEKDYLQKKQIENNCFPFKEKILIINNVKDLTAVKLRAKQLVTDGVLTKFVVADDLVNEVLVFFNLKRDDFRLRENAALYGVSSSDWVYYNSLGPLTAIYVSMSPYLLFQTGDSYLDRPVQWIHRAIKRMEKDPQIGVANLLWNNSYREAKQESYRMTWNFFYARQGFSDQQFLVKKDVFRAKIFDEIREDSHHYPVGDLFEKRVFSFLKNHQLKRIIYRRGSYTHQNII